MSTYDHHFIHFGRPPVPDDLCKDSALRHPLFWRRRFLKVFITYGHGSHLGQWIVTILAIYHYPAPRRLHMKFEQHLAQRLQRSRLKFSTFSHTNEWHPYKCIGKQTRPRHKKVKCQCTTIILAPLVDPRPR